ncbi:prepilin-type N-terminal cleavage/methylation domain-containing protein [Photobacterium sanguinicancri]|uniref:prepilin-type N-terminal cleavage/methylation domain-containing protein n=1 Tax=Photobacterium sanguinicancri TaxID=875932 RepID=UPI0024805413|nr:type II secretion system protein [Photobacterium sanguinicancri]
MSSVNLLSGTGVKNKGFTLIELVVVIVILGILAVTAAPRFLNMQVDARNSALQAMKGAIASSLEMGYGVLAMHGLEKVPQFDNKKQTVPIPKCESGVPCDFRYGYPAPDSTTLTSLVDHLGDRFGKEDWALIRTASDNQDYSVTITTSDNVERTINGNIESLKNENCYIRYYASQAIDKPYRLEITPCQ